MSSLNRKYCITPKETHKPTAKKFKNVLGVSMTW